MLQLLAMKIPNVLTFDFMSKPSPGKWSLQGGGHTGRGRQWAPHSRPTGTLLFLLLYIYVFLAVLDVCCCAGFSVVAARRGYPLVAVTGFLIAVASLVAEHSL